MQVTFPITVTVGEPEELAKSLPGLAYSPLLVEDDVLRKSEDDQRYSLGVAYPANDPNVKKGADGRRDIVSVEVLEKAAWSWMKKGSAGLYHFNGAGGGSPVDNCCEVVESYIYRGPDWLTKAADGTDVTIRAGTWLMGAVWDERVWPLVKSLRVSGWSPEGGAKRAKPSPETLASLGSS